MTTAEVYLMFFAIFQSITIIFLYLFAQTVLKFKTQLKTEDLFVDELDKAIDKNVVKIAKLEYELKLLKGDFNKNETPAYVAKPVAPKKVKSTSK